MSTYNKIYNHQHRSCFYCKKKVEFDLLEKEHVFPKSKGGRGIKNKVLSCHFCNELKSNLTITEFKIKINNLLINNKYKKRILENILSTLCGLENGQEIRKNFHKKAVYKTNNINEIPIKCCE